MSKQTRLEKAERAINLGDEQPGYIVVDDLVDADQVIDELGITRPVKVYIGEFGGPDAWDQTQEVKA